MNLNIGEIIKSCRMSKQLSQKELAENLGVHVTLLNKWERGERVPELKNVIKLSQHLDIVPSIFPGYKKIEEHVELTEPLKDLQEEVADLKRLVHILINTQFGDADEFISKITKHYNNL